MILDLESQKKRFKDHVATFTDYGDVKILDFKKPGSNEYRIRFLFEEDYYRLHISGDLGELTATNYCNMCFDEFVDYIHNEGYFEEKIDCHSRPLYTYDRDLAKEQLRERYDDYELMDALEYCDDTEHVEYYLDEIFEDYDDESGIGGNAVEVLEKLDPDYWEWAYDLGKQSTGILGLYMLAFELAVKQLKERRM